MEQMLNNENRSKTVIEAELEAVQRDIIALKDTVGQQHEESGSNSPDDNSQEVFVDDQNRALLRSRIEKLEEQMIQLQEELRQAA